MNNLYKNVKNINIPDNALDILNKLSEAGFEAYIVGGCVRDSLLGREPMDWDITTNAHPLEVKKLFKRTIDTGIKHGTVTVMKGQEGYEVTTYRVDGDYKDHRHPESVTFTPMLREDLRRRDFTINAMAWNPDKGLVDEFGGIDDLNAGIIRCVGDPMERFDEDALRILRALRFSAQLGYDIEEDTARAAKTLSDTLQRVSAERIQTELIKIMTSDRPTRLLEGRELGINKVILPELDEAIACDQNTPHHQWNVGEHSLRAAETIRNDKILRLSMLLHDIGKPSCKTTDEAGIDHFKGHAEVGAEMANNILRRLKMDNASIKKICLLVRYHDIMMKTEPTDKLVRKMLSVIGPENLDDLISVKKADVSAQSSYMQEEKLLGIERLKDKALEIIERGDALCLADLAVKGADLIEAGIKPGKEMGDCLKAMLADVLNTPSHNTREYLLRHIKNYL
ncbi:CCA tRNA nucleotidyltransferase [Butyrivibrio sp. MC2013]|uniref:CCA tRNA nucleotidyltransferase n=1 Tax=Butyrivibrio sp. MC2013 TaxID=1280686 RepID=UPI00041A37C3|nr:HD domain-containing protein [Butyrivibrio sp. MC2013]